MAAVEEKSEKEEKAREGSGEKERKKRKEKRKKERKKKRKARGHDMSCPYGSGTTLVRGGVIQWGRLG